MASITTRTAKGSPLTHAEVDANFTNLNTAKAETASPTFTGTVTLPAGTISDAEVSASAAIADTKLATISTAGKVSNSATTAASANTASAIVARDASGNFSAGTITAGLTGAASSNVLKAGDTMTGALATPLGAAATPSLTFTGDLNTGIYSPGADQVAISTNGTGRLFINDAGRVGLGTNSPAENLVISNNGGSGLEFNPSGVDSGPFIQAFNRTTSSAVPLTTVSSYFAFRTGSSPSETMRLDSSGRLGLGSSAPSKLLTVKGADGSAAILLERSNSGVASLGQIGFSTVNGIVAGIDSTSVTDSNNGALRFWTTGGSAQSDVTGLSPRMVITSGGLVGIGTTTVGHTLEVRPSANDGNFFVGNASGPGLQAGYSTGGTVSYIQAYNTTSSAFIDLNINASTLRFGSGSAATERARIDSSGGFQFKGAGTAGVTQAVSFNGSAPVNSLVIDSSGRLGLGTSSPGQSLSIVAPSTAEAIGVWNRASDNIYGGIYFKTSDGATGQSIILNERAGTNGAGLLFYTKTDGGSVAERVRIDSSGRVGIGTTAPNNKLEIAGTTANLGLDGTGNTYINFLKSAANIGYVGDANWTFGGSSSDFGIRATSNLVFGIGASERARIDSSGRLGLGTSAPGNTLHVNSGNIGLGKFSDQAAATRFVGITGTTGYEDVFTAGLGITTTVANQSQDVLLQSHNFGIGYNSLILKADGKVGIGTASPQGLCDVAGSNGRLVLANGNTSGGMKITATNAAYGANGYLAFEGYSTEYGRFDSSGRLLIGTSSVTGIPATLNVIGGNNTVLHTQGANADSPFLFLSHARGTGAQSVNAQDGVGAVAFVGYDGTNALTAARIEAFVDGTPGANDMPGRLVFSTTADGASSPTERMRISANGAVSIGTTGTTLGATDGVIVGALESSFTVSTAGQVPIRIYNKDTAGTRYCMEFRSASTAVGSITHDGTNTSYTTSSDYRLKENVTVVTNGITRLQQLKPSRFNFISNPDKTVDGFIAHEAQAVVPECVTGEKDEVDADGNPVYQGIDQSKLVPLLTAALQEAITEIASLKDRVAALEGV